MSAAPMLMGPELDGPQIEVVSPELALVDPALAARARMRLADPGELPVRIEERAWGHAGGVATETVSRPAPRRQPRTRPHPHPRPPRLQSASEAPPPPSVDTDEAMRRLVESAAQATPSSSSSRGRRWELFALAPALIATALLVASTRLGDPQPTAPSALEAPATVEPSPLSSRPPVKSAPPTASTPAAPTSGVSVPAAASRDFVWAPTDGASGYHVELYRGSDRIFVADTVRAYVEVPATWTHDGRERQLVPGEYRWFVWPVVDGARASAATVQSTVTVTGS